MKHILLLITTLFFAVPSQPRPVVLFWGDSITYRWDVSGAFPQWTAINAGIGGQTSGEILARWSRDVAPHTPKTIVIEAGTNDLYDHYVNMSETIMNIQAMIDLTRGIGATPVLSSLVPIDDARWSAHFEQADVLALNARLRALAFQNNIEFVDYYAVLNGRSLTVDGLHPTDAGYAVMQAALN